MLSKDLPTIRNPQKPPRIAGATNLITAPLLPYSDFANFIFYLRLWHVREDIFKFIDQP